MHFVNEDSYLCIFNDPHRVAWRLYKVGPNILICDSQYDGVLMQFTGLLDKNEKEIYEGDVMKYHKHGARRPMFTNIRVFWNESAAAFWITRQDGSPWGHIPLEIVLYEVIGNIYANPELLERQ